VRPTSTILWSLYFYWVMIKKIINFSYFFAKQNFFFRFFIKKEFFKVIFNKNVRLKFLKKGWKTLNLANHILKAYFVIIFIILLFSKMGNMMPSLAHPTKQKKHPKLQKKSTIFMYSNMVKKLEVKNIHDHYVFLKKIGKGSNGPVYKAISNKTSNIRSIKVI